MCSSSATGLAINIVDSSGNNLLFGPHKQYNVKDIELYAQSAGEAAPMIRIDAFGDSTNSEYNFAIPLLAPIQKYYLKFPSSSEDWVSLFIYFSDSSTSDCGRVYTITSIEVNGLVVENPQYQKPIRIVKKTLANL